MKKEIREALANYMKSEGCGCCSNYDAHEKHREVLGSLLDVSEYKDGSGYNFLRYATN